MARAKRIIKHEYNINLDEQFNTYRHVGKDYCEEKSDTDKSARKKHKKVKRKSRKYVICNKYSEWETYVKSILPHSIANYQDFLHYLRRELDYTKYELEVIKCVLVPVYIALYGIFQMIANVSKLEGYSEVIYGIICFGVVAGSATYLLMQTQNKVDFYRDFIEVAEKENGKGKRALPGNNH